MKIKVNYGKRKVFKTSIGIFMIILSILFFISDMTRVGNIIISIICLILAISFLSKLKKDYYEIIEPLSYEVID